MRAPHCLQTSPHGPDGRSPRGARHRLAPARACMPVRSPWELRLLVATLFPLCGRLEPPPRWRSLYPGQSVTGLCPVDSFATRPVPRRPHGGRACRGGAPQAPLLAALPRTAARRVGAAASACMARWCCGMRIPSARCCRAFSQGKLPDLNLGTADGASCDPAWAQQLLQLAQQAPGHTAVLNGRFKGGYITRHYGEPARGIHAVQLEMTQCSYMQEALPFRLSARACGPYSAHRAAPVAIGAGLCPQHEPAAVRPPKPSLPQPLDAGAVLLRGFAAAREQEWLQAVCSVTAQAPFRVMTRPGGAAAVGGHHQLR